MASSASPNLAKSQSGNSSPKFRDEPSKTPEISKTSPNAKSNSHSKLEYMEPFPYPEHVAKYLEGGVFPDIIGGSKTTPAGPLVNAKYGKFSLIVWIWFTVGRHFCTLSSTEQKAITGPDLAVDGYEPLLIQYATTGERWYLQATLVTMNNLWCGADWNYDISIHTEVSNEPQPLPSNPSNAITRIDILTEYHIDVKIPDFNGFVRFKVLDGKQNSYGQTSGCLKYSFKNVKFQATITIKMIDKRFRTANRKYRPPEISISATYSDVTHEILWYPFVGEQLPENSETKIPNLNAEKIKTILKDFFQEKIIENNEELLKRYVRSVLAKVIPHIVEECRTKVDLVLTFTTVLANGSEDDLYYLPKEASKLIKLGVYSVMQDSLRDKIFKILAPTMTLPDNIQQDIKNRLDEHAKAVALLP